MRKGRFGRRNDRPGASRGLFAAFAAVFACCFAFAAIAQERIDHAGYFEVRSASTSLEDGVRMLEARLQLVLSTEALDALNAGVPITIELQTQLASDEPMDGCRRSAKPSLMD